jgi:hypothetical protein
VSTTSCKYEVARPFRFQGRDFEQGQLFRQDRLSVGHRDIARLLREGCITERAGVLAPERAEPEGDAHGWSRARGAAGLSPVEAAPEQE